MPGSSGAPPPSQRCQNCHELFQLPCIHSTVVLTLVGVLCTTVPIGAKQFFYTSTSRVETLLSKSVALPHLEVPKPLVTFMAATNAGAASQYPHIQVPSTSRLWNETLACGALGMACTGFVALLAGLWHQGIRPKRTAAHLWVMAASNEDGDNDTESPRGPESATRPVARRIPKSGRRRTSPLLVNQCRILRNLMQQLREGTSCAECGTGTACSTIQSLEERMAKLYHDRNLYQTEMELEQLLKSGHRPSEVMYCHLLTLYGLKGQHEEADSILQELQKDPNQKLDVPVFNAVIHGWASAEKPNQALMVLEELLQYGLTPNIGTFAGSFHEDTSKGLPGDASLLSTTAQFLDPTKATELVRRAEELGVPIHIDLWNAVMRGYCKAKRLTAARAMIRCLHNEEQDMELVARRNMILRPNALTYGPLINVYCEMNNPTDAQALLRNMRAQRIAPSTAIFNMLLKCFARAGNEYGAETVFREMAGSGFYDMSAIGVVPDCVTYATLMELYAKQGKLPRVVELFKRMKREEVEPDVVVYSTFVRVCSAIRQPEEAERVIAAMADAGIAPNVVIYTSLITSWCLAGSMEDANRVFYEMQEKGVKPNKRTFLALIRGYNRTGRGTPWELVQEMRRLGIPVDSSDLIGYT